MGKRAGSSEKVAEWTARLERLNASGLSVARFCEREGVSAVSVYLWRKKLASVPRSTAMATAPLRSTAETAGPTVKTSDGSVRRSLSFVSLPSRQTVKRLRR